MEFQTTYPLPSRTRPTRKRTLSLTSSSSVPSRITLDFSKAELATVTLHTHSHYAYGSFTPTPSALPALHHLERASVHAKAVLMRRPPRLQIHPRPWAEEEGDSPLSSGFPSPLIPSFSRTTSIPSDSPTTSARTSSTLSEPNQTHFGGGSNELDPIFAKLERKSKLLTKKVYCSTCNKVGSDYPKCGRCDAVWCSRECRMVGGRRHVCSPRT